jgi:hypothetical protein
VGAGGELRPNDSITIDHAGSTTTITRNGTFTVYVGAELPSISIQPGDGNDAVRINGTPNLPTTVFAGAGNETIAVGGGNDLENTRGAVGIDGGDGDDGLIIDNALALTAIGALGQLAVNRGKIIDCSILPAGSIETFFN